MSTVSNGVGGWAGLFLKEGVNESYLSSRKGPCPKCGGVDRFHFSPESGDCYCQQCHAVSSDRRNGIEGLHWWLGISHQEVISKVESYQRETGHRLAIEVRESADRSEDIAAAIRQSTPAASSPEAMAYLEGRGLCVDYPAEMADIKFVREWEFEADQESDCLVSILKDGKGLPQAVLLTAIEDAKKAFGDDSRRFVGPVTGSCLTLGAADPTVVLAEGLETGLALMESVRRAGRSWQIRVAGSAANLDTCPIPDACTTVIIAADLDDAGQRAAIKAAQVIRKTRRVVSIATPPVRVDADDMPEPTYESLLPDIDAIAELQNKDERRRAFFAAKTLLQSIARLEEDQQKRIHARLPAGMLKLSEFLAEVKYAKPTDKKTEKRDWLDILNEDGHSSVHTGLSNAQPYREPVVITTKEFETTETAIRQLACSPHIFQRGRVLVKLAQDEMGMPVISPMQLATIQDDSTRYIEWQRMGKQDLVPCHPPKECMLAVFHQPEYPIHLIRPLKGIVHAPTILADGRIVDRPGYDGASGLYYEPAFPKYLGITVKPRPDRQDAEAATAFLLDIVREYPFCDHSGKAVFLSGVLSIAGRRIFTGCCPMFLYDANAAGVGKGKLVRSTIYPFLGHVPTAKLTTDEEFEKRITSLLVAGAQILFLDNVKGKVDHPALEIALTSERWSGRILGQSKTFEAPQTLQFFMTSNNAHLSEDMQRRVLPCRLVTSDTNPSKRKFSRNLDRYVDDHSADIVQAALTILRWWINEKPTQQELPAMGSFENWSDTIRQAVWQVMGIDPLESRAIMDEMVDPAKDAIKAFARWLLPFGDGLTTAEMLLKPDEDNVLQSLLYERKEKTPKNLGYALRPYRDQVIDLGDFVVKLVCEREQTHKAARRWSVTTMSAPDVQSQAHYGMVGQGFTESASDASDALPIFTYGNGKDTKASVGENKDRQAATQIPSQASDAENVTADGTSTPTACDESNPNASNGPKLAPDLDRFPEIWIFDFEFRANDGNRPTPVCMVACEIRSGRMLEFLEGEFPSANPFPDDALVAAFASAADLGCFLALDWSMPKNVMDIRAEYIVETGRVRDGMLEACKRMSIPVAADAKEEKNKWQTLIMSQETYTSDELDGILEYCRSDVRYESNLFARLARVGLPAKDEMAAERMIDVDPALMRGQYTVEVARMEWRGLPLDAATSQTIKKSKIKVRQSILAKLGQTYPFFVADKKGRWSRNQAALVQYIADQRMEWATTEKGNGPVTTSDYLAGQAIRYPILAEWVKAEPILKNVSRFDLQVGKDNRARTGIQPWGSITGRNQPSNSEYVFGLSHIFRRLLKPVDGKPIAYLDYSGQELALAGALSGDVNLQRGYMDGDFYLSFAKMANAVPPDAKKNDYKVERDRYKRCALALSYGGGVNAVKNNAGVSEDVARKLILDHKRVFRTYHQWSASAVNIARAHGRIATFDGWSVPVLRDWTDMRLKNFPLQAAGAAILRRVCHALEAADIPVIAPVHDAVLIELDDDKMAETMDRARTIMVDQANDIIIGCSLIDGFSFRVDSRVVQYPEVFIDDSDDDAPAIWQTILDTIEAVHG